MIARRWQSSPSEALNRAPRCQAVRFPCLGLVVLCLLSRAAAQQENPVYVDDSPRAWELFRLARDQAKDNAGEAVRLYQELLDDYAMKLLPINEAAEDHFVAVRARVIAELLGDQRLLERYRLIETAEARRLLESGQLRRVAITRSTTEPGLEALLRLAQDDLESASFRSAMDWLTQAARHPNLSGQRAAHCWFMIGLAAHYLSDTGRLNLAVRTLRDLGTETPPLRRQLDRLIATSAAPPVARGISPLDRAEAADLDQLVAQPIWSVYLQDTPLGRSLVAPPGSEHPASRFVEQMRRSGALLTAAPTVAGSAAYVNEGRTIRAVDRFTGRPLWPPHVDQPRQPAIDRLSRQIADLNIVALRDSALVTLTGHAYTDAATSDRTVVCLDAPTGALRWASRIDRLEGIDELEGLFPHGAPVIAEGMVFVLARKVTKQLLTSCYVIALDLEDGRLRWARHVASSGGIRSRLVRPFSTIVHHQGDLVVATAIGAVARIGATTGQTRWLRRYHPPLSPYLPARRPWEIGGPAVTPRGVIALRPDHRRVILLDWDTGDEIESVPASGRDAWNAPRYFLANERWVFAVGSEIRSFRLDALERPAWSFPSPAQPADQRLSYDAEDVEIRGRVQLVDGALIVPTVDGLLLVDDETGRVLHRVGMDLAGNPLAAGPQLILAGSDRLQAYMPLGRAEQMLRRQAAVAPTDPAPALALIRLGMQVRDLELALEAADLTIRAINHAAAEQQSRRARQELFEALLELDRQGIAETVEQGESLHAMIGVVALEPDQRVEHLLAYGDWLSSHALGRAVEAYQTILSTPSLASSPRTGAGVARPSAAWATQRLGSLIAAHGRGIYQPQADFARIRLGLLRRDQDATSEQFIALATEFPFAESAIEAAIGAAVRGDLRSAVSAVTTIYRLAPLQQRAARLLGLLVSRCEQEGRTAHARAVLRYVVEVFGDTSLMTAPGRRDAATWLAELSAPATTRRKPRVGDNKGTAEPLPGTLMPIYPGATAAARPDRALIYDAPRLSMITDPTREPSWSATLGQGDSPSVLRFDERSLLLWVVSEVDGPRAVMLDATNGWQRWTTPSLSDHLEPAVRDLRGGQRGGALMPNGQPFNPAEALPLVGRRALIVVRRSGEAVALDLRDGQAPVWRRIERRALEQVHLAQIHDFALVLAGMRRPVDAPELAPAIAVLDPETGNTLHEIAPLGGSAVQWMTIGPLGALVYGTTAGVEMVDLLSGEMLWSNVSPAAKETPRGWLVGAQVVVESRAARQPDGTNPLRAIRLDDGTMSEPFGAPVRGEWDRLDLRDLLIDDGRIFARYGQRIVRFDRLGAMLGADIVSDDRDYKWLLPTADRLLLVSRLKSEQVMIPGESRRQTQHTYRLYSLSENCRLIGEAFQLPAIPQRLSRAAVIDGWLLLSDPSSTLAVALPPNP